MYSELGESTLKSGEIAKIARVRTPDSEWGPRLIPFLAHKGGVWNWQNERTLLGEIGRLESYYYVARVGDEIYSTICTWEHRGAGILGHVFTEPKHRRKGACKAIMDVQLRDFGERGGEALYLSTGFDSVAWHIYHSFGFQSIYPGSGHMDYYTESKDEFERAYFVEGAYEVRELGWEDWAALNTLTCASEGSELRLFLPGVVSRASFEGRFLEFYSRLLGDADHQARVLEVTETGSVVGLLHVAPDEHFGGAVSVLDLYLHPRHYEGGSFLLDSLDLDSTRKLQAYAQADDLAKIEALKEVGFEQEALLAGQVVPKGGGRPVDVAVMARIA